MIAKSDNPIKYSPTPIIMPIAVTTHIPAAVVMPRTVSPAFQIIPLPKNPTPVKIPWITRPVSAGKRSTEILVNAAAATAMMAWVR